MSRVAEKGYDSQTRPIKKAKEQFDFDCSMKKHGQRARRAVYLSVFESCGRAKRDRVRSIAGATLSSFTLAESSLSFSTGMRTMDSSIFRPKAIDGTLEGLVTAPGEQAMLKRTAAS